VTQIFVDMDGVLADFDTHHDNTFGVRSDKTVDNVDWAKIAAIPNYYENIPPMPDMQELWDFVSKQSIKPIILTGIPYSVAEAADNKKAWVKKNLGDDIEVRCCSSKDKCLHASPGDVLIDDWTKYKHLWVAKGGVWITHTSAKNSIIELLEMGIGL
jgi:hypothetical protein